MRLLAVVEILSLRLVGTACWIWFESESTALRTLPTAPLTLSVTELEVTEVARDRNEVKPLPMSRLPAPPTRGGAVVASSTLCERGAKVTLFDRFELAELAEPMEVEEPILSMVAALLASADVVAEPLPGATMLADISCCCCCCCAGWSPKGSGNDVEYLFAMLAVVVFEASDLATDEPLAAVASTSRWPSARNCVRPDSGAVERLKLVLNGSGSSAGFAELSKGLKRSMVHACVYVWVSECGFECAGAWVELARD